MTMRYYRSSYKKTFFLCSLKHYHSLANPYRVFEHKDILKQPHIHEPSEN